MMKAGPVDLWRRASPFLRLRARSKRPNPQPEFSIYRPTGAVHEAGAQVKPARDLIRKGGRPAAPRAAGANR